jgi:acyl carrier protein
MDTMNTIEQLKGLLKTQLQLGGDVNGFDARTQLFGVLPEFDSMAVVTIVTALEEQFDIVIEDDDLTAEVFATLGSLAEFVDRKVCE